MKIALIQFNSIWEDKKANFQRAADFVRRAAEEKCAVVVFPEMFATGFSMDLSAVAEEGYGETPAFLAKLARDHCITIIAGFAMMVPGDNKAMNMALVFNPKGKPEATYTKIHPFSPAGEDKHFIAGEHTVIFKIDGVPCSVFICYDLRFPETFRKVAKEAQAVFVLANWPSTRKEHWETLLKARAIENQCFIIGVNRTGTDGNGLHYPGASAVFGPLGGLVRAGNDTEEFLTAEIEPSEVAKVRAEFPFLNDMKPDNTIAE
jgi:predicted amidohydrolase